MNMRRQYIHRCLPFVFPYYARPRTLTASQTLTYNRSNQRRPDFPIRSRRANETCSLLAPTRKHNRKAIHSFSQLEAYLPKQQVEYIHFLHDILTQPQVSPSYFLSAV
jgi:hypothetical protein